VAVRLVAPSAVEGIPWWFILTPLWIFTALLWLGYEGAGVADVDYTVGGRFWLLIGAIAICKFWNRGLTAAWSWEWIGVVIGLAWGIGVLINIAGMGGSRYLVPAYVILVGTVPLAMLRALTNTKFDFTWLVILLPSIVYLLFCAGIVQPRIRTLRARVRWRNYGIKKRLESGEAPVPVPLETKTVAMPLPGSDPRFRLGALLILLVGSISLQYGVGWLGGWISLLIGSWLLNFSIHLATAAGLLFLVLYYYWVFLVAAFACRWLAARCNCGNRVTLWVISLLGGIAAFIGFLRSLEPEIHISVHEVSLSGVFLPGFVLLALVAGLASVFGLYESWTPSNREPPSEEQLRKKAGGASETRDAG
jgi:hypothetical protein